MNAQTLNLTLPTSWAELSQQQLYYLFLQLSRDLTAEETMALCLFKWSGLKVITRLENGLYLVVRKEQATGKRRKRKVQYELTAQQLCCAALFLEWIKELPTMPIHLDKIGRHKALAVDFDKVPFEKFLYVDNLWQGYLQTKDADFLRQMAEVLYDHDGIRLNAAEEVAVFYWFASLKAWMAKKFDHFLKPVGEAQGESNGLGFTPDIGAKIEQAYNAQVRALTGGDITKEHEVLQSNTLRALAELNAKAKEAEEYRKAAKVH